MALPFLGLRIVMATSLALVAMLAAASARADESADGSPPGMIIERRRATIADDQEEASRLDERLAFLEARICRQRTHAEIWWWGFTTFYFIGGIYQGYQAFDADTRVDEADAMVGALKAVGGVLRLGMDPYGGIEAFEPMYVSGDVAAMRREVARGEEVLRNNADTTHPFGPWYAHAINVGLNAIGAVVVGAGFDGWKEGLISAAIGTAVGEVQIFTGPWEADSDLDEYEEQFDGRARSAKIRLSVEPMGAGLGLNASF
jgi:hypothetical protein